MSASRIFVLFSCGLATVAIAEPIYPINPQQYGAHKAFGPPKPITPQNVLTTRPENQFDLLRDGEPNAVNQVNDRMDKPFHFTLGQFGKSSYAGALWRQREANYYVIGSLAYSNAEDYKDGDGHRVNYGYQRQNAALILGLLPTIHQEHRVTLVYDNIDDDKQPQHVMDPVKTRRLISKYHGRFGAQDNSNTLHIDLSAINLKRHANNFDLRFRAPKQPHVLMRVQRQKYDVDVHYNIQLNAQHRSSIGLAYQDDTHDAKRFVKTPRGDVQNGYRFPDIKTQTTRLYASHQWQPAQQHTVKAALNYTWQNAKVRAATRPLGMAQLPTPQRLWQMYYGKQLNGAIKQNGLSGKLRYTFKPSSQQQFYGEIASLYRLPENTERFAVLPGPAGSAWGLNPWIKPERENRFTLGFKINGAGWGAYQTTKQDDYSTAWQVDGAVFYADVDDFITLDRYRGRLAPLRGNIISRNVDAKLWGADVQYRQNWIQNLSTALGAHYRYGQNQTDHRPLYQIAPFAADVRVDWRDYFDGGSYSFGSRLHYQHQQNRRDDNTLTGLGIDNATKGFSTLDLYGGVEWKNNVGLSFGIDNVFDRNYALYFSGNHVEAIAPSVVNAPGRTFWLRLNAAF